MSIEEEAYFNAEFVDIVTSEDWDFPIHTGMSMRKLLFQFKIHIS